MLGIAMLTIVRSSSVMKKPSDTTTRTAHGFPRSLVMLPTIAHQGRGMKIYLNSERVWVSARPPAHRPRWPGNGGGYAPGHGAQWYFGDHFRRRERARRGHRPGARGGRRDGRRRRPERG